MGKSLKKGKGLWNEFKEFINRGNAFMLAVGVVIGGAFSAIVNAFVNILMNIATWGVPGGLAGLVTTLPAANKLQEGVAGVGQEFMASDLQKVVISFAQSQGANVATVAEDGAVTITDAAGYAAMQTTLLGKYTLHGGKYIYNMAAIINWGALINAFISFLIIAIVLFIIVKVVNTIQRKNEEIKAKAQEAYYQKHPEERPVPPEPGKPEPTELDYLKEIRDALVAKKEK